MMVDKKWWTLIVVGAGTFMLLLDVTIVVVALPNIQTDLHASFSDVQWVIDAYALTLASLLLTTGAGRIGEGLPERGRFPDPRLPDDRHLLLRLGDRVRRAHVA